MPVKERAWCLRDWFAALESQGVEHTVLALLTPSEDETEQILKDHGAEIMYDLTGGRKIRDIEGHVWGKMETFAYMADMRNELVQWAKDLEADYFFSLDSDIILEEGTLSKMLKFAETHPGVVSPAVNMTQGGSLAWNTMDWVDRRFPNLPDRKIHMPKTGQRDVVMAAMLLDRSAMECKWAAHKAGEDIGFAIDAWHKQVPLWWIAELRCTHLMRRF
jgi:hypothetical protein